MALFDIYFSGEIVKGHDLTQVKPQLGKLFKVNPQQLERLFSGKPVRIKAGIDKETATKYYAAIHKIGAVIEVRPCAPPSAPPSTAQPPTAPPPAAAATKPRTAPPPRQQQAAEEKEEEAAATITIPASMSASADYGTLEELPGDRIHTVRPPQKIPSFQVAPPRTGSLEEFAPEEESFDLPDLSALPLAPEGSLLDQTPPAPAATIDTSKLSAAPANSGSLEEYAEKEIPLPLPDISQLKLDR